MIKLLNIADILRSYCYEMLLFFFMIKYSFLLKTDSALMVSNHHTKQKRIKGGGMGPENLNSHCFIIRNCLTKYRYLVAKISKEKVLAFESV